MFRWLYRIGFVLLLAGLLILAGLYAHSYRRADSLTALIHTDSSYRFVTDRGRFQVYSHPHLGEKTFWLNHTHYTPKPDAKRLDQSCEYHAMGFGYRGEQPAGHIWPGGGMRSVDVFMLVVPAWTVLLAWALLLLGYITLARRITKRYRRRHNLCTRCGYDLRSSAATCPECGHAIAAPAQASINPMAQP